MADFTDALTEKHIAMIAAQPVFFGGPVQFDHGFVLHRPLGDWKSTLPVVDAMLPNAWLSIRPMRPPAASVTKLVLPMPS